MKSLLKHFLQVICLSVITRANAADVLHYMLLPGSTITPYTGATPIGPTESLAGTFDWVEIETGAISFFGFDAVSLSLRSESFLLALNTNVNDETTSVFASGCLTYFSEVVDYRVFGLAGTGDVATFGLNSGCYSGPPNRPTSLVYPELAISPHGGGIFLARLNIVAALDNDLDGVPDEIDECPNTPAGSVVDAHGCSLEQRVPCSGPRTGGAWRNHGDYVSALAKASNEFLAAGLMTENQKDAYLGQAAQSNCGKK